MVTALVESKEPTEPSGSTSHGESESSTWLPGVAIGLVMLAIVDGNACSTGGMMLHPARAPDGASSPASATVAQARTSEADHPRLLMRVSSDEGGVPKSRAS